MNRLRRPLASRVVSYRLRLLGSAHSRFGSFASQKTILNRFCSLALAGYPAQKEFKARLRSQRKKETDRNGLSLFLAEKERFELSRRVYPTYTLSRGASSANLSTSPCSNQGFIPCGSPFFKSALLLYPILSLLSISFFTFPLFIFDFSALALEIILRVCYNYPNGLRVHYRSKEIFYEQQQSCGLRMSLA